MSDYTYSIAGKAGSAAAQMVMLAILALKLPPSSLATLLAVYSFAAIVAALGDLGLGTLATRERAYGDRVKADNAVKSADHIALLVSVTGSLTLAGLSTWRPELLACVPLLLWGSVERVTETRTLILIADGRVKQVAALNAVRRFLALALFLVLSVIIPPTWAFSSSLFLTSSIALYVTHRWVPIENRRLHSTKAILSESLPFTVTSVSGQSRNLDVPIVEAIVGGVQAASYGLGSRFASPILLIFSSTSSLVLVRARRIPALRLFRGLLLIQTATVALSGLALLLLPSLLRFVTGYIDWLDAPALKLLLTVMVSYTFAGVSIIFGSVCVAYGLQNLLMKINLVTATASLVLITYFSLAKGNVALAAGSSLVCYFLQSAILLVVIRMKVRSWPPHP